MKSNPHKKRILFSGILIALFLIIDITMGYLNVKPMKKLYMEIRAPHHYYHHGLTPCKSSLWEEVTSGYGYPLTTDSLGFKDSSMRQVPLQVAKKRVLFIGDSFTEGIFFPYESTFVGLVAQVRPDLDILNAGVTSYSPLIYYLKVDYLLNHVGLKFDELFVFIDMSDIQDEYLYIDREKFKPSDEPSSWNDDLFNAERFVYNHSYTYNIFKQVIQMLTEEKRIAGERGMWTLNQDFYDKYHLKIKEKNVQRWAQRGIVHAEENMQKLVDLCKKNNIAVTIAVYPWDPQIYAKDKPSKQEILWSSFAQKNGVGFLDLFPAFVNEESPESIFDKYFLPGDLHWNAAGHALVASYVLNYMQSRNPRGSGHYERKI